MFDAHCDETSFVNLSLLALVYISGKEMSSPNRPLPAASSVPPNKKDPMAAILFIWMEEALLLRRSW